jgi:hypothetical protein
MGPVRFAAGMLSSIVASLLSQFSVANCQDHFKITYRYNFSVPAHARS